MIDVEERARRAGQAVRAEAHVRASRLASPEPRPVRPWSTVLVAAGVGLAALLVVVALASGGGPPRLEIEPLVPGPAESGAGLPVPEVGDVVATQLADGTPVFVTQPDPGEVLVLDAVDRYLPGGARHLLVSCRSDGLLEDLRWGTRYDQRGNWIGGPGPTGLTLYPSELAADGSTVRIVGGSGTAPARDAPRGEPARPSGERCFEEVVPPYVMHRPPDQVPSLDGTEIPGERWVWASLVLSGPVDRLVVCDADGTCDAGPIVATDVGSWNADREVPPTSFVALAKSTGDGHVELLFSPYDAFVSDDPWHPFDLVRFEPRSE